MREGLLLISNRYRESRSVFEIVSFVDPVIAKRLINEYRMYECTFMSLEVLADTSKITYRIRS